MLYDMLRKFEKNCFVFPRVSYGGNKIHFIAEGQFELEPFVLLLL